VVEVLEKRLGSLPVIADFSRRLELSSRVVRGDCQVFGCSAACRLVLIVFGRQGRGDDACIHWC